MIENDEQLKITKEYLINFYKAFMACFDKEVYEYMPPSKSYKAEAYKSMIERLQSEIYDYEEKLK